jgi:predicted ATPase/DNA-binding winged helix-turn-helix (wHTH) protein
MNGGQGQPIGWRFTDGTRDFRLFPAQRQFLNGDNEVELNTRAFDLLVLLVRNAGRVVSRDEIIASVWRNYRVSDSTVSSHITFIRQAVGAEFVSTINAQGYQFTHQVESIETPPLALRPVGPPPGLPHPAGHGVGRTAEMAELVELSAHHRVVTIVGPGGVGKTWLAVALGWHLGENFPDGVYLVDLGPVRDATALASAVAQRLSVALRTGDNAARIIGGAIDKRKILLILDGCEYIAEFARAMIEELLAVAPNLSVLATSQATLRVPKEAAFRLQPLDLDDAIWLFTESVRAVDTRFDPDNQNKGVIAEICRRLDGMPLAIEMAAATVPLYGIKNMLAGVDERFDMLDSTPRPGLARQSTLSAVMDWSYGLLDAADQETFRRLSAFSGSFSADAAAAVAWRGGASKWRVPAGLGRLVDKSLVVVEEGEQPRYRLLETISLYAASKLKASGEQDAIAQRHAEYYTGLFEYADELWETMPDAEWAAAYGPDIDNARSALDWALAVPERQAVAVTLGGAVAHLWERLNLSVEGRAYMDRLVSLVDGQQSIHAARVLRRAGTLWRRLDRARAVALAERSVALYRQIGDRLNLGTALGLLGGDYVYLGRHSEAEAILAEARTVLTGSNHDKSLFRAMTDLGNLAVSSNDLDKARHCYTAAREIAQKLKDTLRENIIIFNLGEVEFRAGEINQAIEYARESASGLRAAGHRIYLGWPVINLASYLAVQDKLDEARHQAIEALMLIEQEGGHLIRPCLQLWALLGACDGRYPEAAQLLGYLDADYARSGEVREPTEQRVYTHLSQRLSAGASAKDITAWATEGARWNGDHALDFVRRRLVTIEN